MHTGMMGGIPLTNLVAVGRKVLFNGVFNDTQELFVAVDSTNAQFVEKLNHETGETFKGTRDTDVRVDFDKHVLLGMDVDLEKTRLVDRAVEECQKALSITRLEYMQ